ncbi:MAG: hypothetical protein HFE63_08950 [Clostridiales bacterium]|nr:hypothetical protein [Clostridiales bacterium]
MDEKPQNDKVEGFVEADSKFKKWFDNFWYHYKAQTIIAGVAIITAIICSVQMLTKDNFDYYTMYAGPQILAVQDGVYIQRALSAVADDYNGDGDVKVALNDIVMLSPDEVAAAQESGAVFDAQFQQQTKTEFYQQIIAGDAVICFLSPYVYNIVSEESGFLPLAEIFGVDDIPESAYDDCGIVLSKTEFGQTFNGIDDLPPDTILCIRRISTLKHLKGAKKTEKHHAAYVELFRAIVNYTNN